MKCTKCDADIPGGMLYCPHCGQEVRIVPDYNPLDEVLTEQVRGSLNEPGRYTDGRERRGNTNPRMRNTNPRGRVTNHGRRGDGDSELERRRKQQLAEKKRKQKKKQKIILISGMILSIIIIGVIIFLAYRSSYSGLVSRGNQALSAKNYEEAKGLFEDAVKKGPEKAEAYIGLGDVYIAQKDVDAGEAVFLGAVKNYPNEPIYRAAIEYYIKTEQMPKISELLDECKDDTIKDALKEYQSDPPEFSLEGGSFEDVQELTLSSTGKDIYYTVDGSKATTSSTKYEGAIQISEGTTIVRAISVNHKDVPSLEAKEEYIVELPIEDAPAVTPSTGQYNEATDITIKVPEGYTAYYTTDGSVPTTSSKRYKGPIEMEEGNTLFSAILVNANGKASDVTKRNYMLELGEEE